MQLDINITFLIIGLIVGGIISALAAFYAQKALKKYEIQEINKPILLLGRYIDFHRNQGEENVFIEYVVRNDGVHMALEYQVFIDGIKDEKQSLLKGNSNKEFSCQRKINNNMLTVEIYYKDVFGNYFTTKQKVYSIEERSNILFSRIENIVCGKRIRVHSGFLL